MPRHAAHFRIIRRGPIFQVRFTREGKDHRLSTGTGDKRTAESKAKALVQAHDSGGACDICRAPAAALGGHIKRLAEEWLTTLAKTHPPSYGKRALTDLAYIEKKFSDPTEITSTAWEAWKHELHTTATERRERLTWGSIANLANTLRAFLRFACGLGAISSVPELRNPSAKQLASDRAYLRPLNSDEQQAILWALALGGEARALHIYIALFETWMRKGALEAMTPRWINWKQEQIRIPSMYTKAQLGDLEIDLTPRAAEAIKAEMETGNGVQIPDAGPEACAPRVASEAGSRPAPAIFLDQPIFGAFDYRYLFPRIAEQAGIDLKGLTAHHVTRRTAATLAGAKPGASLNAIKAQGGWRTSAVVDRYMKPSVEAARKVTR